jgi:thiosulfate reductase cytochrome b subunit
MRSPALTHPPIAASTATIHPVWLRVTHWLNAMAAALLVSSGWRIYNAAPLYDFVFPRAATIGGWLGGALQWHFAAMWLLAANGVAYLAFNAFSGRAKRKFFPITLRAVAADFVAAVRGRLAHADPSTYNAAQRTAYLFATLDIALLVLSGLVLWKSVQFPLLREALGGYDTARHVHFFAMAGLVGFVAVHLAMVMLVPRTLLTMLRGR